MNSEKDLGIGAKLKKSRLQKNLTLKQVHKKTKIPLEILEAVEEDRIINIAPVYIKGFLKIYCNLLGVDHQEFTQKYLQLSSSPEQTKREQSLLSGIKVKVSLFSKRRLKIKFILIIGICIILVWGIFKLTNMFSERKKKEPQVKVARSVKPSTDIIKVAIRAKGDCWVKAMVDGKVVFQNILKKGRFETWEAKNKIELSLGNAGGVELEVNGKLFSPLGRRGQVIKRILINRQGLKVIK